MITIGPTHGWTLRRPWLVTLATGTGLGLLIFGGAATVSAAQAPVGLGTAAPFAVLAGSGITNTGATTITGDVGLSPGSSITGSPTVNGTEYVDDPTAVQAKNDLTTAYNSAASAPSTSNLTGQDLGNKNLSPGVYTFSSSAQLTGTLTLSGNGVFIFQIGSTLTTASGATVVLVNGAQACNVFWQVGSSATLGTTTQFQGTLMALTSISLDAGANILDGRALAQSGAVTLDNNQLTTPTTCSAPVASPTPTASPSPTTTPTATASPTPGVPVPTTGTDLGSPPGGALLVLGGLALMMTALGLTWRLRRRRPTRS
jgi:hypothetical protein